jgi:predicted ATPase
VAAGAVVGRDAELATVAEFFRELDVGPATLLIEGEPGIGKTTLWAAALREAEQAGVHVLACRSTSAETRLTFVGLADFLTVVEDGVLDELPSPQRRALDVALLREEPEGEAPEQRVVATAFLSVLRALARSSPVLVAVDDLHWLDTPSRHVLEFALRRRMQERIGLLAALRPDGVSSRRSRTAAPVGYGCSRSTSRRSTRF